LNIGRVVATLGRRVVVRHGEEDVVCFLSGQRAVVGDRVRWVEAAGEGGKLVGVEPRVGVLVRTDLRASEQVLAANLQGILVVTAGLEPPFRPGLLDRYLVAAALGGLAAVVVLNKVDLGVPDDVEEALALRASVAPIVRVSARTGEGLDELTRLLAEATGPWCLVGHSGVGKTSLAAALLPDEDVGAVGDISEHWGTGQHTTTGSRLFVLPGGGELVDSPGIRTFAPGGLASADVRDHFPAVGGLQCRYRDCLHREGEDGCVADAEVPAPLLASYRRLLAEVLDLEERRRPGKRRSRTRR
jgi:ribosome biogenesis GTPase